MYLDRRDLFTDENLRYVKQLEAYVDKFLSAGYRQQPYEFGIAKRAVNAIDLYHEAEDIMWCAKPIRNRTSSESDCYRKAYVAIRTTYAQLRSKALI